MNATLKSILVVSAKQAVNAILTNAAVTALFPQFMQWGHTAFWYNVGKVALAAVASREAMFWAPKLLAWSQSNGKN